MTAYRPYGRRHRGDAERVSSILVECVSSGMGLPKPVKVMRYV